MPPFKQGVEIENSDMMHISRMGVKWETRDGALYVRGRKSGKAKFTVVNKQKSEIQFYLPFLRKPEVKKQYYTSVGEGCEKRDRVV